MNHLNTFFAIMSYASSRYTDFYNIYKQIDEEVNVDLFFCDYIMNFACFDIAWKLGKPVVGIATMLTYVSTPPLYRSDPLFGCHVTMENESFYSRFRCAVIEFSKYILYIVSSYNVNSQRAKVDVDPYWDTKGRISNILMLTNNFYGFEIPMALPPLHQEIGPILPDTFPNLTPDLNSFLAAHPRTIYFALGSFLRTTSQNLITILKSFVELIDQNIIDGVIWATVKSDISKLPSTSDNFNITAILNNDYPNIHVINKRKYRGADLIEVVMNAEKFEGIKDKDGKLKIDNNVLLKEWITPNSRMGFIRGNYLDVYSAFIIIFLTLCVGSYYSLCTIARFFTKYKSRRRNSRDSSKPKTD
ncbi:UDP-Glycosyltransferase/glycogen phosphorylase [Gigaspora margarita]|uniref:UDP-Glycosyltransferase/glycogen phosphorylase n=1 Tax=Gigaspora margarita TaxID=4874 RepID=A0A8H3XGE2_GIGMA|nr:UDP-Glycosyltransferase/glycogen phosphorylase [Gigaspora margarita]